VGKGFTECRDCDTYSEFLDEVSQRCSSASGLDATPLSFAHSLYSIGYHFYRDRFAKGGADILQQVLKDVFDIGQPRRGFRDRVSYYTQRMIRRPQKPAEEEFKRL